MSISSKPSLKNRALVQPGCTNSVFVTTNAISLVRGSRHSNHGSNGHLFHVAHPIPSHPNPSTKQPVNTEKTTNRSAAGLLIQHYQNSLPTPFLPLYSIYPGTYIHTLPIPIPTKSTKSIPIQRHVYVYVHIHIPHMYLVESNDDRLTYLFCSVRLT